MACTKFDYSINFLIYYLRTCTKQAEEKYNYYMIANYNSTAPHLLYINMYRGGSIKYILRCFAEKTACIADVAHM